MARALLLALLALCCLALTSCAQATPAERAKAHALLLGAKVRSFERSETKGRWGAGGRGAPRHAVSLSPSSRPPPKPRLLASRDLHRSPWLGSRRAGTGRLAAAHMMLSPETRDSTPSPPLAFASRRRR